MYRGRLKVIIVPSIPSNHIDFCERPLRVLQPLQKFFEHRNLSHLIRWKLHQPCVKYPRKYSFDKVHVEELGAYFLVSLLT